MESKILTKWICAVGLSIGLALFLFSFQTVLNGPHGHRQADSIAPGYFYCTEPGSHFMYPHIGPRGDAEGVAINEFPLYAYALGKICQWKGSWDEYTPRILSLVFAIVSGFLFWLALIRKYNLSPTENDNSPLQFFTIYLLLPVNLTFFTIPMPESTALLFYSSAAFFWTHFPKKMPALALGSLLLLMGFLIRPFYILFLFFFAPHWILMPILFLGAVALFWLWYRLWNSMATTNHGYFGIQTQSISEIIHNFPHALQALPKRIFEHTALIGLVSFYLVRNQYRLLILFYLATLGMMYALKSTHIPDHAYYLLNAGLFASFIIFLSLRFLTPKLKNYFLIAFLLLGFQHTQHNFHANGNWEKVQAALDNYGAALEPEAKVATYLGLNPHWLYFLKRTGWIFTPQEYTGVCPQNATHALYLTDSLNKESQSILKLERCQSGIDTGHY